MKAYYNEIDPFAAAWLRELIKAGLIAPGDVDERDIQEVRAGEISGYVQHHFFAGIGGWSLALRLAGWPDNQPVWTGSCPCQPFSAAGRGKGASDARHLWPAWFSRIRESLPPVVFGEQVEAAIGHGWWDAVQRDLEGEGYATGMAVLGAHSVGAPHRRQRLWFVARRRNSELADSQCPPIEPGRIAVVAGEGDGAPRGGAYAESGRRGDAGELGHSISSGLQGYGEPERERISEGWETAQRRAGAADMGNFWRNATWLPCRDGKLRPTQPSIFPLAHGISSRVGLLRGAGNAIVPQVAAEFIAAYMEIVELPIIERQIALV